MKNGLTEQQIVDGLRAGNRQAWVALCDSYGPRLWRFVARLIGRDESAVADVYQETLLAVAEAGRRLRVETRIWSWLTRIGHNQVALFWRRRRRAPPLDVDAEVVEPTPANDPVKVLTRLETVECVRVLLAEMDADQVALLSAKYLDDLSARQISELLGGTHESVRSRLARARREFQKRFARLTKVDFDGE